MRLSKLLCLFVLCGSFAHAAERPNIVLILCDDLGIGDPRCYNPESRIPTPNMDRLAAEGRRFTDAHSPSAVCTPTRYGLLTGRYCWRTSLKQGVLWGESPLLIEPNRVTVASLLKQQGYVTAGIGKWHLGLGNQQPVDYSQSLKPGPTTVGFDTYFGIPASLDMVPYVFVRNDRVEKPPTTTIAASAMRRNGGGGFWRGGAMAPGFKHEDVLPRITDEAVGFIDRRSAEQPFFLYLPLSAPHTPWLPTAEFRGQSGAGHYGDFAVQVDTTIGRVLKALDDRQLAESTLLIFTSDNGAHWLPSDVAEWQHRANHNWRGQKADIWEGGHRVPFIARWPGKIEPGATSDELLCLTDILATCAAVVGTELPRDAGEDSYNMLPALLGEKREQPIREGVVHHSVDGTFAIRRGTWKLALALGSHGFSLPKNIEPQPGGPRGQLYNLAEDPAEEHNLWLDEPEIVARLTALLKKYQDDGRSTE